MSKELIERLRADAESTDDIGLCADAAERIEELERERDAFYMDYRMKCDEQTKSLCVERDALQADNARLREAMKEIRDDFDCDNDAHRYGATCRCCLAEKTLAATPEQSLAEYRNKVIEECAAVLNVAITRLSSCGASIKNDVAISTLKEQSCRLRAMKEQP